MNLPDQTLPDQIRPEQTLPDQTRPNPSSDPLHTVLTALAAAQPPAGMQHRILHALHTRPEPSRPARSPWTALTFALGAALVALASLLHHPDHTAPSPLPSPTSSSTPTPRPAPSRTSQAACCPILLHASRRLTPPARLLLHLESTPQPGQISFPPRQAPLSAQEKLLLEFAQRHATLTQVAEIPATRILNPDELSLLQPQTVLQPADPFPQPLPTPQPLQAGSISAAFPLPLLAWDTPEPVWPTLPQTP